MNQNQIVEYMYLKKEEFSNFAQKNKIQMCTKINKSLLSSFAHQKQAVNPHLVNPFYVKKIGVEKND